ncbi:hypothetical protein [Niallia taxi]|uniref:hypothetical protein n=1 Tax=Niallia taxi TaxID=2499688 RepID=UPI003008FF79
MYKYFETNLLRYEKAFYALLNLSSESMQDDLVDIITDTILGHELMEQYEEDSHKGQEYIKKMCRELINGGNVYGE